MRRALADLDNLRKRYARELRPERAAERARVAAAFLPVLDNLDLALAHAGGDPDAIVDGRAGGARPGRGRARRARLPAPGRDRCAVRPAPPRGRRGGRRGRREPAGTVPQVLRPGYGDGDRQLRPAAVAVADRPGREPWPATTTTCSGSPATPSPDEIQQAYRQAGPRQPPGREQGPGRRGPVQGDQRGVPRAVRPGDTRAATTASARTSGGFPRTGRPGSRAGAAVGARAAGAAGLRLPGRRGATDSAVGPTAAGGSTSRTCSAACSAARRAGAARPVRRRGPGGRAAADRRGGVPGRPPHDHAGRAPHGPRTYDVTIPPGVVDGQRIRLAGEGGRAAATARRATCTWWCGSPRTRGTGCDGRDIVVQLPVSPWEAALGATVAGGHPRRRGEGDRAAGHLHRAAAAPARAGHAQPARGAAATCTPRSRVMVPPRLTARERELFAELANVSTFDPRRELPRSGSDGPRRRKAATS